MQVTTTIYLQGLCDEALPFYADAIGAELLSKLTVGAVAAPGSFDPANENKVIRAALRIGDTVIYLADGHRPGPLAFEGFSLSLKLASRAEAERALAALADGGTVKLPLAPRALAEAFGTVVDRYGVHWSIEAGTGAVAAR